MKQVITDIFGKDVWWGIIVVMLLLAVIGAGAYALVTGKELKGVEMILVQLFSFLTLLLSFRYGSSKGSKDKDNKQ